MGALDKILVGVGIVIAGAVTHQLFRGHRESERRRSFPPQFDDVLTEHDFNEVVQAVALRTPRVSECIVTGMTIALTVRSNSRLSIWRAEIDFNDYGRLTGAYWLNSENSDSPIPRYVAGLVQDAVEQRIDAAESENKEE
ncbi:hypothetical protein ACFO7V_02285 [Glutamicibacter bergerei]|uniref:Uncharacterized protein n=1 Tax=Glutamicibacter bergerei TaxID=256702 RepID=A0ABV9MGG7_9MICC|nr:hypothetical protein [Micrococcaceae bacterium]